ncbi:hypothetical protein BDQ17DRAFT_1051017 [Cyathus striatus]|nr:hypothetical protein BDQ17DRAFT_1051017 [Cyathus striatus]
MTMHVVMERREPLKQADITQRSQTAPTRNNDIHAHKVGIFRIIGSSVDDINDTTGQEDTKWSDCICILLHESMFCISVVMVLPIHPPLYLFSLIMEEGFFTLIMRKERSEAEFGDSVHIPSGTDRLLCDRREALYGSARWNSFRLCVPSKRWRKYSMTSGFYRIENRITSKIPKSSCLKCNADPPSKQTHKRIPLTSRGIQTTHTLPPSLPPSPSHFSFPIPTHARPQPNHLTH